MTTEEDIATAIKSALRAVDQASVPEDLRGPAFEKAFEALVARNPGGASGRGSPAQTQSASSDTNSPAVDKAAAKLRVDPQLLERVLDFDDDGVHVIAQRSRFARAKASANQQVAALIVGGATGAGLDNDGWVPQAWVRQAAEELGVDDPSNFSSHMRKLNGIRAKGSGKTGELKMNAVGFEAVADLVVELADDGTKDR